jgi:hypothetical protein
MSKLLDKLSEFIAHRKGLLPIIGLLLIMANFMIQFIIPGSLFATSNFLLHIGLVIAIFGLMLSWAL